MKYWIVFLNVILYFHSAAQTKHALLIGVGKYESQLGWSNLSSANDIPILKRALLDWDFEEKNIHSYVDDPTMTPDGILAAIQKHLVQNVKPGDIVYFHFSGHGQQIADDEANPDELDGLDESLVTYDAPAGNQLSGKPYAYDKHLRDDDLERALREVRKKLGSDGDVFVSIDACHSGSATRGGSGRFRGSMQANVPDNWVKPIRQVKEKSLIAVEADKELSPMVVVSASLDNQLNFEHREGFGSLSFSISKVLSENNSTTMSYAGLFDRVRAKMATIAHMQTPVIEGDVNRNIFGGQAISKVDYWRIKNLKSDIISIPAGKIHGLNVGDEMGIFDPDVVDFTSSEPIAKGKIIHCNITESDIQLDSGVRTRSALMSGRVVPLSATFSARELKIRLVAKDSDWVESIKAQIFETSPYIKLTEQEDFELLLEIEAQDAPSNYSMSLIARGGTLIWSEDISGSDKWSNSIQHVEELIHAYNQGRLLRNLSHDHRRMKGELRVLPVTTNHDRLVLSDPSSLIDQDTRQVNLHPGNKVIIEIVNTGALPFFFNLLEIDPANKVNVIFPCPFGENCSVRSPQEFFVAAGDSLRFTDLLIEIAPPSGTHLLKLILSRDPLDLRDIFSSGGSTRGASGSSFESYFAATNFRNPTHRGMGHKSAVKLEDVGIATFIYHIEED
jgi:metacaspase-1